MAGGGGAPNRAGTPAPETGCASTNRAKRKASVAFPIPRGPPISQAIRATSVVVLPLPAGAMQSTGPGGAVAAARWSGASFAIRSARGAGRSAERSGGSVAWGASIGLTLSGPAHLPPIAR